MQDEMSILYEAAQLRLMLKPSTRPQHLWPLYWCLSHSATLCLCEPQPCTRLQDGSYQQVCIQLCLDSAIHLSTHYECGTVGRRLKPSATDGCSSPHAVFTRHPPLSSYTCLSNGNKKYPNKNVFKINMASCWGAKKKTKNKQIVVSQWSSYIKAVNYTFSHNGATLYFLTMHPGSHNKALLFFQYIYILRHSQSNKPAWGSFLSMPDRSLRFSLMGISTQHALHVGWPPFVAVKSSFYAC